MKIAIISTFLGQKWSGAEISSFLLAKTLNKKEDVFVVTSKIKGKMPFKCYSMPLLKSVSNLVLLVGNLIIDKYMEQRMFKIFKKEKPDIVHIQDFSMMISGIKAAKKLNIPTVFTARSYQFICNLSICLEHNDIRFNCNRKQYFKCLKRSIKETYNNLGFLSYFVFPLFYSQNKRMQKWFKKIDCYVAVSDFVRKQIIKIGINENKIKTIKVQKEEWNPSKKKDSKVIVFSAGGLKKTKGFDYLIRSFAKVIKKCPNSILRIAGEGSEKNKLEGLIEDLGLEKNVELLGKVEHDRMEEEYANANFVVSPSLWPEPLTRIIFEAFSMKRAIIATDVGGSSELVKDGETGLLVNAGNEEEMSDAVIKMIKNKRLADKMGLKGYKLISMECGEKNSYNKCINLYSKLNRK